MSRRSQSVVAALVITLLVAITYGTWLNWDWKVMAGWQALVDYIDPNDATGRKDAVQVYAVIVAGMIASITAFVGLLNLRLTRRNLKQQRELEAQRAEQQRQLAQGTALQAYYEQIGKLLTEHDLLNTKRKEIRELARGQTLTVLREVDGNGKGSLLTFLQGAGLIGAENPAILLPDAHLRGAYLERAKLKGVDLQRAHFRGANLREADLQKANLQHAYLQQVDLQDADLRKADLQDAHLRGANLQDADLREANLRGARLQDAKVTEKQLAGTLSLQGATMPNGSKHP